MMNNLRVYTDGAGAHGAGGMFYSQRADGPRYRWWLDEREPGRWRVARLRPAEWNPKALLHLSEKDMPAALQARLAEHYMW